MKTTKTLFLCALLVACGDDSTTDDGGLDATTQDGPTEGSTKDATTTDSSNDAKTDVAVDSPSEAATDAGADVIVDAPDDADDAIADAAPDTSTGCDGGCTTFSFECSNASPACQCVALTGGEKGPVCDAAPANCFKDPCQGKSAICLSGVCVVQ